MCRGKTSSIPRAISSNEILPKIHARGAVQNNPRSRAGAAPLTTLTVFRCIWSIWGKIWWTGRWCTTIGFNHAQPRHRFLTLSLAVILQERSAADPIIRAEFPDRSRRSLSPHFFTVFAFRLLYPFSRFSFSMFAQTPRASVYGSLAG